MPLCSQCPVVSNFPSIQALKIHYKIVHSMHATSNYKCVEENCLFKKSFASWARMRRHYRFHHRFHLIKDRASDIVRRRVELGELHDADQNMEGIIDDGVDDANDIDNPEPNVENFKEYLTQNASRLVAKFYSRPSFPRSLVQIIVDDVGDFVEGSIAELKKKFQVILDSTNIEDEGRNDLNALLDDLSNPFVDLSSDYLRLKFFENSGHLVPATEIRVGERYENKFIDNKMVRVIVPCTAKHLKLRHILKKLFELPGVLSTVFNYVHELKQDDSVLRNFVQGNLWIEKSAPYEAENKKVLPLFIGIDDLEINNPLGSHTGVSEVGAVYASVPCLPPEFSSRLDNIFLTLLYHSQDRKLPNGNYNIFKYLVNELNYLAREGIVIRNENKDERVYFVLGLILGDNKGLNEVLGFSGSFSANYYCRFCRRHKTDCLEDCEVFDDFVRQPEQYAGDVQMGMAECGVKENSVWLKVDHFHPYKNFASCTLHDFDEGVSKYAMPLICHYFILDAKIFDVVLLNERIRGFNYQVNGFSNKIPPISEDNLTNLHFRMSGSEMRTFVLCFNFLVGDYVPLESEYWKYYLILRRLIEFVACKAFPKQSIQILKNLIKEHNCMYRKLFGSLKPKMHLLLHYILILLQSGPMPHLSMIRNEGKHKEIKDSASATNSRKNVTHTFALKQQLKVCYRFASGEGLKNETITGRSQVVQNVELLENYHAFSNTLPDSFINSPCVSVKWLTYKGITYRHEMCVVLDLCDSGILLYFGVIKNILINASGQICFICMRLNNFGYDYSMGAYEVENSVEWQCVLIEDLHSPFPTIKDILSNGKTFVGLRCLL